MVRKKFNRKENTNISKPKYHLRKMHRVSLIQSIYCVQFMNIVRYVSELCVIEA